MPYPSKDGYSFVPVSRSNVKVIFDQSNQDYAGTQDQPEPSSTLEIGYHGTPIDALTREDKRLGSIADSQERFS